MSACGVSKKIITLNDNIVPTVRVFKVVISISENFPNRYKVKVTTLTHDHDDTLHAILTSDVKIGKFSLPITIDTV